jgi:hypothetical protein
MATTYTHKKSESNYEIYRNDDHVATYDPVTEEVDYVADGKKYAVPISKEVSTIAGLGGPVAPKGTTSDDKAALIKARKYIESLEKEVQDLKNIERGVLVQRIPDRYKGITINPEGSPVMGMGGDLTPEFVEWCRAGGHTKEHFLQRFDGRIQDLTYPAPKKGA